MLRVSKNGIGLIYATCLLAVFLHPNASSVAQTAPDNAKAKIAERNALIDRAIKLSAGGKIDQAIQIFEKMLATDETAEGRLASLTLNSCLNLARALYDAKRLDDADRVYRDLVDRYNERRDRTSRGLIQSLTELGSLQRDRNRLERSEAYHRQAVSLAERAGRRDATFAFAVEGLGHYFSAVGEFGRALPYFVEARKALIEAKAQKSRQYVNLLQGLGATHARLHQIDESRAVLEESLSILRSTTGENDPLYLLTLKNEGVLCLQAGQFDESQRLLQAALALNQKQKGIGSPTNASFLLDMSQVAFHKADFKTAEKLIRQAQQLLSTTNDHLENKHALRELAIVCAATGRFAEAFELQTEILEADEKNIESILSVGSEEGMFQFLQTVHGSLEQFCNLAVEVQKSDARAADIALKWVLRRKAIVSEIVCHFREQEGAALHDPSVVSLAKSLHDLRQQLARIAFRPDTDGDPELVKRLTRLEFDVDRSERQLHRKISAYRKLQTQPFHHLELNRLRKALPSDGALVEFFSLRSRNFKSVDQKTIWGPEHYFAFVLHPKEEIPVELVDLGPAAVVNKAIQTFRTKFEDAPRELKATDEKTVEEDFRKISHKLHDLIFAPCGLISVTQV